MGHLRGEGVGGGMPESCRVELDEKKEAEEISLFRRSISYRTIRANKRRKGRFTEVVRDIFDKRPEIFINRRAMEVSALPFYESTLSPSKNIPAVVNLFLPITLIKPGYVIRKKRTTNFLFQYNSLLY